MKKLSIVLIIFLICVLVLFIIRYIKDIKNDIDNEILDGANWEKTIIVHSQGCCLPQNNKSIEKLITKIKNNPNWVYIDSKIKTNTQNSIIAYRFYEEHKRKESKVGNDGLIDVFAEKSTLKRYRIVLMDSSKVNELVNLYKPTIKPTFASCEDKQIVLVIKKSLKTNICSLLIFKGDTLSLVIQEESDVAERVLTNNILNKIKKELEVQ